VRRLAVHEILEEIERLLDRHEHGHHHHAHHLRLTFRWQNGISIEGDHLVITEPLVVGFSVQVSGKPKQADQSDSPAKLSLVSFTSSDPAVFTVAPDPTVDGGGIVTSVGPGSATLIESATATEPDGTTTNVITGSATVVVSPAVPVPGIATSIELTFGTPFPTPPTTPPTP
jgi:hypothetical protein